jgi:formamidopyrimidine-DNA glycosylase
MPELPEIAARAKEMTRELTGKKIIDSEILQPKSLNMSGEEFQNNIKGSVLRSTNHHGKWLLTKMDNGWILINLGMGGEVLLVTRKTLPEKYRIILDFEDQTSLAINFWWFGSVHYALPEELNLHPSISRLGPNALGIDSTQFKNILKGRRGILKSFLLDQTRIAGIGNFYIHDILFTARLHPLRQLNSLRDEEVDGLYKSIHQILECSLDKGGAFYEKDLYGNGGGYLREDMIIGYMEDQRCPRCDTPIQKIKTGSTSSYICPQCQPIDGGRE